MPKLFHDQELTRLMPGGETHFHGVLYTRWFCQKCKAITMVPKELIPS